MADNGLGVDTAFLDGGLEFFGGVIGEGFGLPLLGGGCEDLDGGASNGFAATDGVGESFSGGHVGADESCGHFLILTYPHPPTPSPFQGMEMGATCTVFRSG